MGHTITDAELLSSSFSCGKACTSVRLLDAGCKAVDEDVTIEETGVVGCCTAAQVSVQHELVHRRTVNKIKTSPVERRTTSGNVLATEEGACQLGPRIKWALQGSYGTAIQSRFSTTGLLSSQAEAQCNCSSYYTPQSVIPRLK